MPARKLINGRDCVFWWTPAEGVITGSPLLVIDWPSGSSAYQLDATREPDTVTAISADRRTLSVTWGLSGSPSVVSDTDQPAPAVLAGVGVSGAAVRVVRVASQTLIAGTLELAEPLPHVVLIDALSPLSLHWSARTAFVPAVDQPARTTRNIRWTVDYDSQHPSGAGPIEYLRDRDVLHTVSMPFATGLTDAELLEVVPDLKARPSGQGTWRAQREAALDELMGIIRKRIAPRVEDVLPGRPYANAHAYLTAARVLDGRLSAGPDFSAQATYLRGLAVEMVEQQLALVDWADIDLDGVVDDGEADAGARGSAVLSSIASTLNNASVVAYLPDDAPIATMRTRISDER
jgi:hypothetical protein